MNAETTDAVERLYEVLVDEIRTHRPELLDESFTVAEIYQKLVPYRTHRDRIGVEMNGDYEHALLRLLAGDGGYVTLESDAARSRLREELESVRPDTGIYRNFAACEVRLEREPAASAVEREPKPGGSAVNGGGDEGEEADGADVEDEAVAEARSLFGIADPEEGAVQGAVPDDEASSSGDSSPEGRRGEPPSRGEPETEPPGRVASTEGPETSVAAAAPDTAGPPGGGGDPAEGAATENEGGGPGPCAWCRERLPSRDDLRFCPFCGSRVDLVPCPDCGAELEADWHFCVACGAEVRD